MKQLKDLKEELLKNNIQPLYIFYGEDYGLRHHYIEKIKENFTQVEVVNNADDIRQASTGIGLFNIKRLYIVHRR